MVVLKLTGLQKKALEVLSSCPSLFLAERLQRQQMAGSSFRKAGMGPHMGQCVIWQSFSDISSSVFTQVVVSWQTRLYDSLNILYTFQMLALIYLFLLILFFVQKEFPLWLCAPKLYLSIKAKFNGKFLQEVLADLPRQTLPLLNSLSSLHQDKHCGPD